MRSSRGVDESCGLKEAPGISIVSELSLNVC
jgi:hypothetical protein